MFLFLGPIVNILIIFMLVDFTVYAEIGEEMSRYVSDVINILQISVTKPFHIPGYYASKCNIIHVDEVTGQVFVEVLLYKP